MVSVTPASTLDVHPRSDSTELADAVPIDQYVELIMHKYGIFPQFFKVILFRPHFFT